MPCGREQAVQRALSRVSEQGVVQGTRQRLRAFLVDCQTEIISLQAERDTAAVAVALATADAVQYAAKMQPCRSLPEAQIDAGGSLCVAKVAAKKVVAVEEQRNRGAARAAAAAAAAAAGAYIMRARQLSNFPARFSSATTRERQATPGGKVLTTSNFRMSGARHWPGCDGIKLAISDISPGEASAQREGQVALKELSSQARLLRVALKSAEVERLRREETMLSLSRIVYTQKQAIARFGGERRACAALQDTVSSLRRELLQVSEAAALADSEGKAARGSADLWREHCLVAQEELATFREEASKVVETSSQALHQSRSEVTKLTEAVQRLQVEHAADQQRAASYFRERDAMLKSNNEALALARRRLAECTADLCATCTRAREDAKVAEESLRTETERGRALKAELTAADEDAAQLGERLAQHESAGAASEARAAELMFQLAKRDEALAYVETEIARLTKAFKNGQARLQAERDLALSTVAEARAGHAAAAADAAKARACAARCVSSVEERIRTSSISAAADCAAAFAEARNARLRAAGAEKELHDMLKAMERKKAALLDIACDREHTSVDERENEHGGISVIPIT